MKIKVERKQDHMGYPFDNYFLVSIDGQPRQAFSFMVNQPKDAIYTEERAKREAMAYVENIETNAKAGINVLAETVIYEKEIEIKESAKT